MNEIAQEASYSSVGVYKTGGQQMAENGDKPNHGSSERPREGVLLIAQVRALLLNGETIDLLPFKHDEDVRAEVNKFVEDWVKTGFLLKENFLYPWHQVKLVEVVSVEAISYAAARPYLDDWRQDSEAQKLFWKTRKPQPKTAEKKGDSQGVPVGH
jgi:hypothetical protein